MCRESGKGPGQALHLNLARKPSWQLPVADSNGGGRRLYGRTPAAATLAVILPTHPGLKQDPHPAWATQDTLLFHPRHTMGALLTS